MCRWTDLFILAPPITSRLLNVDTQMASVFDVIPFNYQLVTAAPSLDYTLIISHPSAIVNTFLKNIYCDYLL